jgi:hypothetical protein
MVQPSGPGSKAAAKNAQLLVDTVNAGDYNEAFRAHGEGLRVVARGDLATRGSYKWLRPTQSFAIIPGLEDETLLQMGKQPAPPAPPASGV